MKVERLLAIAALSHACNKPEPRSLVPEVTTPVELHILGTTKSFRGTIELPEGYEIARGDLHNKNWYRDEKLDPYVELETNPHELDPPVLPLIEAPCAGAGGAGTEGREIKREHHPDGYRSLCALEDGRYWIVRFVRWNADYVRCKVGRDRNRDRQWQAWEICGSLKLKPHTEN